MNQKSEQFLVSRQDADRCLELHLAALAGQSSVTRNLNRRVVRQFIDDLCESTARRRPQLVLDECRLVDWLIRDSQGRTRSYAIQRVGVIRRYLQVLKGAVRLKVTSLSDLGICAQGASIESLISAFHADDPQSALASLSRPQVRSGPLAAEIESYLKLHQSLGKQYRGSRYDLWSLDRFLRQQGVSTVQITAEIIQRWIEPMRCITAVRARKIRLVRRFFDYLVGIDVLEKNPVSHSLQETYRTRGTAITPYIFTREQIEAILSEARQLRRTGFFPLRPEACYTMFALLYGLGLRCGEVRRLQMRDLDLAQQTLLIRETKFYKSRYVPFGPKLGHCLEEFLGKRRRQLAPVKAGDPLFVTLWRSPIHDNTIREPFTQILQSQGIDAGCERRKPRLHDLRHSFAVHRLARWYREGVDVQSRLPLLSTFLGHTEVKHTQVYLTATDELLQQAGDRFFQFFTYSFDEDSLT